jgi:glycyl-tRNA synthetase alpha subunit
MSVAERAENIGRIRHLVSACCHKWIEDNDIRLAKKELSHGQAGDSDV